MDKPQLEIRSNLTELVECTVLSVELCIKLKEFNLVNQSEYETLTNYLHNGRPVEGAVYLFTSVAKKISAAQEKMFIEALREGGNTRAALILSFHELEPTRPTRRQEVSVVTTEGPYQMDEPVPIVPLVVTNVQTPTTDETLVQVSDKVWYYSTKQLGISGGFSTVFEGYLEHPTRRVAVKKMKREDVEESKEIEILRKVDHEFIVRYHINEIKGDLCYVVMDLAESTLDKWITQKTAQDLEELVKICKQVTIGLNHLHQNKIVHRDIKPTNVLIVADQAGVHKAKITDFGISRIMEKRPDGVSTQMGAKGTLTFFPPEAHETPTSGRFILKPNFDIFPLGIVLAFTMTRGKHIFQWRENDRPIKIQANVSDVNVNWEILSGCEFRCLKNLLQVMLKENPEERNVLSVLLKHPFFWKYKKQFKFIMAVSNDIKNKTIDEGLLEDAWNAYKSAVLDVEEDWKLRLDAAVQEWIKKKDAEFDLKKKKTPFGWRKYDGIKLVQLLNFIRDQHEHYKSRDDYPDLSDEFTGLFGKTISKYEDYFVKKFPELCAIVFNVLHDRAEKGSHSAKYFKEITQTVFTLNWN